MAVKSHSDLDGVRLWTVYVNCQVFGQVLAYDVMRSLFTDQGIERTLARGCQVRGSKLLFVSVQQPVYFLQALGAWCVECVLLSADEGDLCMVIDERGWAHAFHVRKAEPAPEVSMRVLVVGVGRGIL